MNKKALIIICILGILGLSACRSTSNACYGDHLNASEKMTKIEVV